MVSVDVKQHSTRTPVVMYSVNLYKLCVCKALWAKSCYGHCAIEVLCITIIIILNSTHTELRSRVKVEVALMVSVDVNQHWTRTQLTQLRSRVNVEVVLMVSVDIELELNSHRPQGLCKSRGTRYGLCWRKATLNSTSDHTTLRCVKMRAR